MNTKRYRLHDFADNDIAELVRSYVGILRGIAGSEHAYAYRAGGWVIQPFDRLRSALLTTGVRIDSTVFHGGIERGVARAFDFRQAPRYGHWQFDLDPCKPDSTGKFLEVPIASLEVGPRFYWALALHRKLGQTAARPFGDGSAIELRRSDMFRKLVSTTSTVASMDGYKSTLLETGYRKYRAARASEYVLIGHPKAISPFALARLDHFLDRDKVPQVMDFRAFRGLLSKDLRAGT